jgi:hypothetical protein
MATIDTINGNLQVLGFDSQSSASVVNKIADAIAPIIDNTINEITNSENVITDLLISQYGYGKTLYYTGNALAFQFGDNLTVNTAINPVTGAPYLNMIYAVVDTTKQIIKQAAFQSITAGNAVQLFLKIATIDALSGNLIPLTTQQLNAFTNYMVNFEIPGLPLNIINLPGNILNFTASCTYLAAYDLPTLQTNVANALTTFQDSFPFNGEFYSGDLQDYVKQQVPGVRDFYVYGTSLDGVPFSGSQSLPAGYFNYQTNILNNISYTSVQP